MQMIFCREAHPEPFVVLHVQRTMERGDIAVLNQKWSGWGVTTGANALQSHNPIDDKLSFCDGMHHCIMTAKNSSLLGTLAARGLLLRACVTASCVTPK